MNYEKIKQTKKRNPKGRLSIFPHVQDPEGNCGMNPLVACKPRNRFPPRRRPRGVTCRTEGTQGSRHNPNVSIHDEPYQRTWPREDETQLVPVNSETVKED